MDTVAIILDKERHLRYTWGSINRFKQATGLAFGEFEENDERLADFSVMAAMLWAGLVWEDDTLTIERVADMVDIARSGEVIDLISRAMDVSTEPADPTPATASEAQS